jgi:phosphoenolpyruvate synthase/pyruvate phosphate dikinase
MNGEWTVALQGSVDPAQVGGKAAQLAELHGRGVRVPDGFAVTAAAYQEFVREARLDPLISQEIRRYRHGRDLGVVAAAIRTAFRGAEFPDELAAQILAAYDALGGDGTEVVVRCSPVFPQRGTTAVFLHVNSGAAVLMACRRCFASLFGADTLGDRELNGPDHLTAVMPVTVQRLVRSDLGASGTARAESTFVRIHAAWGLGAPATGDVYSFHPGPQPLIVKHRGSQQTKTVYADPHGTREVPTTPQERAAAVLTDDEIAELGTWSVAAENYFGRAMELEWAKDGRSGELYLVEVRPWTVPAVTISRRVRPAPIRVP